MKIITKIETIDVPGDNYEHGLYRKPGLIAYGAGGGKPVEDNPCKIEFIQGKRFVDEKGNRFTIGMTAEVRETLGIPFDAMENMGVAIEQYQSERAHFISKINRYQSCISKLGRTGFWKRFKFLFTGILIEEEQV